VRVVAGEAKGRRLAAPGGRQTRPTSDKVREAMFNALHSLVDLQAAGVVDLFAGTGALGIEALSRGAVTCTFVETSATALRTLRANLDAAGMVDRAEVVAQDALAFVRSPRHDVGVVFADPPYAFDEWPALLAGLAAWPASLLVLESDRDVVVEPWYDATRRRRYGGTVVTFAGAMTCRNEPARNDAE
jgi:16S rRNA (guanine966-N2)-methyltransferase